MFGCCCLLSSFLGFWLTVVGGLILLLLLWPPSCSWLLDLNPIHFRLPLPNVNDAAYRRNRRLISSSSGTGCEKMHSTVLSCPKSLALDRTKQQLYTGTLSGKVYCCSLVQSDDSSSSSSQTAAPAPEPQVLHSFDGGRPLGMRLSSDGTVLYFIEASSGLYAYDLQRKECRHLLDLADTRFLDGRPSKFFDDLAVDEQGGGGENGSPVIYLTDVSRKFAVDMWVYTYLEPDSSGRILRYDLATGVCSVVLENLCFPNGIEVTEGGRSLLICELSKRRILQHQLKGPSAGLTTVFIDNLPGEPENTKLEMATKETYWIGLALTRDYRSSLSFLENYSTDPNLRKLILRSCFIFGMAIEVDGKDGSVLLSLKVKDDVSVISEVAEVAGPNGARILYTGSSGGPMGKIVLD
ncbi:hypothetical protein TYRP_020500 [Tyrophagus putrescentiae]|nr:hypothetical protein TYRP_020500 [Tyrophagus putrescentiae]